MKKQITAAALAALVGMAGLQINVYAEGEDGQTPPEMPSGETGQGGGNGGTPPEKPDGDEGSTPPDMPSGGGEEGGNAGTPPDGTGGGQGGPGGEMGGGMGGANTQSYDYSGTLSGTLTADGEEVSSSNETVDASEADVNTALSQNGGTLTIDGDTLTKSGDDTNGDNCNFYGINAISLTAGEGSKTLISNTTLNSASEGSNAIFATDSGTVYAENDTITTTSNSSRGLDATYGGTIIANDMNITTSGDHCAAAATDRGGGSVSVANSTLNTNGSGSPLLYSTGDIEADNVTGTATGSQIAGMEGLNTILIYNSDLTSTITKATASDPIADGVIIYQSTSGDAETATGERARFEAVDSTLSSAIASGTMFYVTNTSCNLLLSGTVLDFDSTAANLLQIEGNDANSWGTAGANGGDCNFTAYAETLSGNISVDSISTLNAYFLQGTSYTGAVLLTENSAGNGSEAYVSVSIDETSSWIVTADTTITDLHVAEGGTIADAEGKTVTILAGGETVVQGDSSITVTVTGTYDTAVTTDENNLLTEEYIDRSGFDTAYNLSTTFGSNGSEAAAAEEETAESEETAAEETEETGEAEEASSDHTVWYCAGGVLVLAIAGAVFAKSRKKNA